jgi:hypothetical protein
VGLRGQELSPGRSGPLGCGIDSGDLQDLPHRRGGDLVAESDQLALDASIPVGAENSVTSCDVHVLVQKAAEPVSS